MSRTGKYEQQLSLWSSKDLLSMTRSEAEYCKAWAQMMVEIWIDRAIQYKIRDTGAFMNSFKQEVMIQSGGHVGKIIFSFMYYGRMVAMGVHQGMNLEAVKYEGKKNKRDWYSKAFYHSLMVLNEKRAELYGQSFQALISDTLKVTTLTL